MLCDRLLGPYSLDDMAGKSSTDAGLSSLPREVPLHQAEKAMTRRILWKLDLHVLPLLTLLWFANFTDRASVGNAKIAGLERDTGLEGNQFNIILAVLYISYILVELPSNLVQKKLRPDRWIPFQVAMWGLVTVLTGIVHTFSGLVAVRFFLGLCEGGLLPGSMLYLSTLYTRHELVQRAGIFYASGTLSGAFGGLLASAILKMDGVAGLAGWRWIFILEGIATIGLAAIAALLLPTDIASASFLTKEEKEFAVARYHAVGTLKTCESHSEFPEKSSEDTDSEKASEPYAQIVAVRDEAEKFEWREVTRGILEVQVWLTGFCYMGILISLYSYAYFLPTIVTGLGYTGEAAQLHTSPPYVPAAVLVVLVSFVSDKLKSRGPLVLVLLPLAALGYVIAIVATKNTQRYVAVFLIAAGTWPCVPCILSLMPNNVAGHYKRATAASLQLALANCGGFIATFVYTADQQPHYRRGHSIVLAFIVASWLFMAANILYCIRENKARASGRRASNIQKYQALWEAGKTRAPIGDRHPDFRFTL